MESITLERESKRIFAENEEELLNECIKTTQIGLQSLNVVQRVAEGNLLSYIRQLMGEYANISKNIASLMEDLDISPKIYGTMKQTWQRNMVKLNILTNRSNTHVAEMLIKGSTLAITNLTKCKHNNMCCVSKESIAYTDGAACYA